MSRLAPVLSALCFCLLLTGCGSGIHKYPFDPNFPSGPTQPPVTNDPGGNTTGNWAIAFTPDAGTSPLRRAYGSIDQTGGTTSSGQFTTSVLAVDGDCYVDLPFVPTQGFATATALTLNSFGANSQFMGMQATITNGGSILTGTYTVTGGCAGGAKGKLAGTRFTPLTGTYAGTIAGNDGVSKNLTLMLTQSDKPAGNASFLLGGTATFGGFTCFKSGVTPTPVGGNVSGPTATVTFNTDEDVVGGANSSKVVVTGVFDIPAVTISSAKFVVQGGKCNGLNGTGTLIATK